MRCTGGCFGLAQAHQSSVWHHEIEEAVLRMEAWVTSQIATALKISIFNRALCTSSMLARAEILIRYYGRTKVYAMDHRARLLEMALRGILQCHLT